MHKNAFLYNYKGTLNINGTKEQPVVIQGDRLEADYDDVSGQFYGVYLDSAQSSVINYAVIKNGTVGIHIEGDGMNGSNPSLTLTNTIISNHARYGILNFFNGTLKAENCVIFKNGFHAFLNLGGGAFDFNHCDLLGYATGQEQLPAVGISDYYQQTGFNVTGTIRNSVIYGLQETEIVFDTVGGGNTFIIEHSLIRRTPAGTAPLFGVGNLWNLNPAFKNEPENDFQTWSTSPMINAANNMFQTLGNLDIKGISRGTTPDMGAYEF